MQNKLSNVFTKALLVAALTSPGLSQAVPISTYLADRGVAAPAEADNNPAWTPNSAFTGSYFIEDYAAPNGWVGPGFGGQYSDLEALYFEKVGSNIVITGISGAPQIGDAGAPPPTTNSLWREYGVGDFFIGHASGTSFDPLFAIEMDGYTYLTNTSGYTIEQADGHAAGSIVTGMSTMHGVSAWKGVSDPTQIEGVSGSVVGTATMQYEYLNDQHTAFQAMIDAALFTDLLGGATHFTTHWSEACGNDYLRVDVPEPDTLALVGVALAGLGLAGIVRRRFRRGG